MTDPRISNRLSRPPGCRVTLPLAVLALARRCRVRDVPDPDREVEIDLGHTGCRLHPRHRLRGHLVSSDYPHGIWHPGTSENAWYAVRGVCNEQILVTRGSAPFYLNIAVLGDE